MGEYIKPNKMDEAHLLNTVNYNHRHGSNNSFSKDKKRIDECKRELIKRWSEELGITPSSSARSTSINKPKLTSTSSININKLVKQAITKKHNPHLTT